jgi:Flp pilus assembly pilin Flp
MAAMLERLWNEDDGQDLMEYALLLVLVVLGSVVSLSNFATVLSTYMRSAATQMAATT